MTEKGRRILRCATSDRLVFRGGTTVKAWACRGGTGIKALEYMVLALFGAEGLESRSLSTELLGLACFPGDGRHLMTNQFRKTYQKHNFFSAP